MLGLNLKTDPYWAKLVEAQNIEEILTDHAYCEMKAASQCMSLIQSYPEKKQSLWFLFDDFFIISLIKS